MTFKMRSETVALLMFLQEQEFPVKASTIAVEANMDISCMRNRLNRLYEENYVAREQRYVPVGNQRARVYYYWISTQGVQYLRSRDLTNITHIKHRARQKPPKRLVNSVFALGTS